MPLFNLPQSPHALFRYQVVSEIRLRVLTGWSRARAIRDVLKIRRLGSRSHGPRRLSVRTLYRWFAAYLEGGIEALEPKRRARVLDAVALSREMICFLESQKRTDPDASIPEIIRLARKKGIVGQGETISRTTVWRACRRMGLAVKKARKADSREMRRFAHPHRMVMVLADGKHFRAGVKRAKRVALFWLDDATRFGLGVAVLTSENTLGFLAGLRDVIRHHGLMAILYLDRGPGFRSDATHTVVARLDIALVHGEAAYPEGRGKVERFNRTAKAQVLRNLNGNPGIDPDPRALTLRLGHWLTHDYNHTPHESLGGDTPAERWEADAKALCYPDDESWMGKFTISFERTVSGDNVISCDGVSYDMPLGYRNQEVLVTQHLLDNNALTVLHEGRAVRLSPVDLTANARSRRARLDKTDERASSHHPETAAEAAYNNDLAPIVDPDGGYDPGDPDDD